MNQLSTVLRGLEQEALTTFLYTFIHYHRQVFPGRNLLCTTESFLPVANFHAEAQGAGLGELFHNAWLFGHSARPPGDPGLPYLCPHWVPALWSEGPLLSVVGGEQQARVGACGIYYRRMRHPVAYGPCVHVTFLLAADSPVPPQPALTCLQEVASLCGEAPLVFIWCHLGSPQF